MDVVGGVESVVKLKPASRVHARHYAVRVALAKNAVTTGVEETAGSVRERMSIAWKASAYVSRVVRTRTVAVMDVTAVVVRAMATRRHALKAVAAL